MGTSNNIDLEVEAIDEKAAFSLHGGSAYSDYSEDVNVSWAALKNSPVGATWAAENNSGCIRAAVEETAEVVHRSEPVDEAVVVTVLFRRWTSGDSPEAEREEETPRLVAFRCQ